MADLFLDNWAGSDAADATSFANRVLSINSGITAARTAPGDTTRCIAAPTGSLAGCSITEGTNTLTVPSGNHQILIDCESTTGWTSAGSITIATSTSRKVGATAILFTPVAAFGTGRIGFFVFGADLDLSAFSAIHCWLDCGNVVQTMSLLLYSDAAATTLVRTLTYGPTSNVSGYHSAMFRDGAALPSVVRAIGIAVSADPGTTVLRCDQMTACHDPLITPNSISPWAAFSTSQSVSDNLSTAVDCAWHTASAFLTDTTMTLAQDPSNVAASVAALWPHATLSSGDIYVWHANRMARFENSGNNSVQTVQEAGTLGNVSTYSGGWNRTDMSTQDTDGMTVMIQSGPIGVPLVPLAYTEIQRFIIIRSPSNGNSSAMPVKSRFKDCAFTDFLQYRPFDDETWLENCSFSGVRVSTCTLILGGDRSKFTGIKAFNLNSLQLLASRGLQYQDFYVQRALQYGILFSTGSAHAGYNGRKFNIANSVTADLRLATQGVSVAIFDAVLGSATKMSVIAGSIFAQNVDGVPDDVLDTTFGVTVSRDTATVDGSAVASMRCLITSSVLNSEYVASVPLARRLALVGGVPTAAITGLTVTASVRYRRSSANVTGRLSITGGMIIAANQTDDLDATAGTWDTATVSFVATGDGIVSVNLQFWATDVVSSIFINPESLIVTAA